MAKRVLGECLIQYLSYLFVCLLLGVFFLIPLYSAYCILGPFYLDKYFYFSTYIHVINRVSTYLCFFFRVVLSSAAYSYYRIVGIFRSAKDSFFRSVTSRNENWMYVVFFRQNGSGLSVYGKMELKLTKSSLSPKKRNIFPTKYTCYTVSLVAVYVLQQKANLWKK